jgi:predicted dienelactone hydrolase
MTVKQLHKTMLAGLLLAVTPPAFSAPETPAAAQGVSARQLTFTDQSRPVKASMGFAGSPTRRLDVTIWTPPGAAPAGGRPLVIYSHGSYGAADNAMHLVDALLRAGYIVAAPDYPLSSRAAYTKVAGSDPTDVIEQTRDVHFILDQLLADTTLGIDPVRIASMGHSLGAVTGYFVSFGSQTADRRIKAVVLLGGGDPVQAALAANMGLNGNWTLPVKTPGLFLSAEHDAFAGFNGQPYAAYSRISGPKYELMIRGGVHRWFTDYSGYGPNQSNPDCAALGGGKGLLGCEDGIKLTTPAREQAITRVAVMDFLSGYLGGNKAGIKHLRALPKTMPDISMRFEN